ncbi:unnamed protein product [Protopolystoma xenopodis]|uniref:Uncharacterized protein n=1 Tax=Protopolystoma xenopodis TaxID=117903 RepID=A0A3S4ZZM0_9PLAT|nr:unnamed protein product [Protopolystoma xenopodis]
MRLLPRPHRLDGAGTTFVVCSIQSARGCMEHGGFHRSCSTFLKPELNGKWRTTEAFFTFTPPAASSDPSLSCPNTT